MTLLKNEYPELALDNGWFSVKQPDTIQLTAGVTRAQARLEEKQFFAETKPWLALPHRFQQHLGTPNLAERCGNVLSGLIAKRCAMYSLVDSREAYTKLDFPTYREPYLICYARRKCSSGSSLESRLRIPSEKSTL